MNNNRFRPVPLLILAASLTLGMIVCGFALDAILGRENRVLWAGVVRWIAVAVVVFGMIVAYDAWLRRRLGK